MISDADNFSLNFPLNATLKERALLLASTFFFDYRYFEHNPQDTYSGNENGGGGIFSGFNI